MSLHHNPCGPLHKPAPASAVHPSTGRNLQRFRGNPATDLELIGYETVCALLAVDGRKPSRRTVMRHLRRHRDIVRPVKIGAQVGFPVEQILKFIARLKGRTGRSEILL